jgi:hypothetical protein
MTNKEQIEEQEASFEQEDKDQPVPPTDVVAYNELRSCADLVRLHASGKLEIQPDFQRDVVWKQDEQSRFIDSLVKQLPIPSMCFSLDHKTQKWKVIDGLQRMSTIIKFLSSSEWQLSDLEDIHPSLRNTKNHTLRHGDEQQKRLYALVEDVSLPVTIIRCDYSKKDHMRYLFTIFHRLNSGGVRLTNQEIRNCIFTGEFNSLLKNFDAENSSWKLVAKRIWGRMDRFRSVEILLRILAFGDARDAYDGNLAGFLNEYMQKKHEESGQALIQLSKKLGEVSSLAQKAISREPRKKLPLALIEAVLVAIYVNLDNLRAADSTQLDSIYLNLTNEPAFAESARYAVSSAENVKARLDAAVKAFSIL